MARHPRRVVQRNRISNAQIEALISYMEEHTLFARGQIPKLGAQGHIKYKQMWMELKARLDIIGPCIKNEKEWQEAWKRMRLTAKSRKAQFYTALRRTGHDTPTVSLQSYDERISQIFGKYGTGVNLGRELGFPKYVWKHKEPTHYSTASVGLCLDAVPMNLQTNTLSKFEEECFHLFQRMIFIWKGKGKDASKPNSAQMEKLVDFMERHPQLALGLDENAEQLWDVLVFTLNSTPRGAIKTPKAWQRTWTDLIISARQNLMFLSEGTRLIPLSDHHVKVLKLVGYKDERSSSSYPSCSTADPNDIGLQGTPAKKVRLSSDFDGPTTSSQSLSYISRPCTSTQSLSHTSRPSTSTQSLLYTSRPSTSTQSLAYTPRPSASCTQTSTESTAYMWRPSTSNPSPSTGEAFRSVDLDTSATHTASTNAATSSSAQAPTTAAAKSSKFIQAFEDKFEALKKTLIDQLQSCFQTQNCNVQELLQKNNETMLENLPRIISEQFMRALENQPSTTTSNVEVTEQSTEENEYLASVDIINADSGDEEEILIDTLFNEEEIE